MVKVIRKVAPHMVTPGMDKHSAVMPMRPPPPKPKRRQIIPTGAQVLAEFQRRYPQGPIGTLPTLSPTDLEARLAACLDKDAKPIIGYRARVAALRRMISYLKAHPPAPPVIYEEKPAV